VADWWCHRRSDIAHTAGVTESLYHWLMFGLMGVAVLAVLLLQTNAALLSLGLALWALHHVVVYAELRYVHGRREIGPAEQMVHSFLEVLPLTGLALLAVIAAGDPQDWSFRRRSPALPAGFIYTVLGAVAVVNGLPLVQELSHAMAARRQAGASR
jgi:hypothetical protein